MAYPINTTTSPDFPEPLLVYESIAKSDQPFVAGEPYPPPMNGFALSANQSALFGQSIPPFSF